MKRQIRKISAKGDEMVREWDTETVTPAMLAGIELEFRNLMADGYTPADVTDRRDVLVNEFNPNADFLMLPRMQGGCAS